MPIEVEQRDEHRNHVADARDFPVLLLGIMPIAHTKNSQHDPGNHSQTD
jgi:hypothetical protein